MVGNGGGDNFYKVKQARTSKGQSAQGREALSLQTWEAMRARSTAVTLDRGVTALPRQRASTPHGSQADVRSAQRVADPALGTVRGDIGTERVTGSPWGPWR